ncbi:hypothetical protein E1287_20430 [Actinomadura sp. KC06]|uniref:hypothetical protein n=1 Tax=Actinomadura sp. KC06 TaxID=2530369 RepID=UPI00104C1767|nr:hypothetical protein [Actinomadura sp. KC06]TDD33074.1 hypothetical protein E1287_20430 [Actinomadura sp. KC06]
MWAICWTAADHDTGFHDHDVSRGAVRVARGAIRHERLRLDGTGTEHSSELVEERHTFSFDETHIHCMRYEPRAGRTVTIHAYSPPLERTGQYANGDDGLLQPGTDLLGRALTPHLKYRPEISHVSGS